MAGVNYTTSVVGLRDRWNIDFEEELTMTNNKMGQVAQMFSKKLNEDFKAVIWDSIVECRFTNEGLEIKLDNGLYRNNGNWLSCLLTGEAKIVEDEE